MTKDSNFKVMSVNLPKQYFKIISLLKKENYYPSKTEIIRIALRRFLIEEINLIMCLRDKKILNEISKISNFTLFKKELTDFEKLINKKKILYCDTDSYTIKRIDKDDKNKKSLWSLDNERNL